MSSLSRKFASMALLLFVRSSECVYMCVCVCVRVCVCDRSSACGVLQCVAVSSSVLHCVALCRTVLHCDEVSMRVCDGSIVLCDRSIVLYVSTHLHAHTRTSTRTSPHAYTHITSTNPTSEHYTRTNTGSITICSHIYTVLHELQAPLPRAHRGL